MATVDPILVALCGLNGALARLTGSGEFEITVDPAVFDVVSKEINRPVDKSGEYDRITLYGPSGHIYVRAMNVQRASRTSMISAYEGIQRADSPTTAPTPQPKPQPKAKLCAACYTGARCSEHGRHRRV